MSEKPLISLIVPFYNMASLCGPFFDSLLEQTYTNVQLIFVNDGSKDDSEKVILSYKERLEEKGYVFEYYYQDNKGLGGAINAGLKMIRGEFFCWADPDDFYERDAFSVRVDYMREHPECDVLTCDAFVIDEKDRGSKRRLSESYPETSRPDQFKLLLDYKSCFCPGCHMIRTKAFETVVPGMSIYEAKRGQNWQILLPVYYRFDRHYLDVVIYDYITYESSMSHSDVGYEGKERRIAENETIQLETVARIEMSDKEHAECSDHIRAFHTRLRMLNARSSKNKPEFDKYYRECARLGGIEFKDRIRRISFKLFGK